jgi:hypothetical protein
VKDFMGRALAMLICCLAVAGCGGSGESATHKAMRGVLLQLSDFSPAWRVYDATGPDLDLLSDLATCTGDKHHGTGELVRSGTFKNHALQIGSTAVGFDTQGQVSDRVDALGDKKAPTCLARILQPLARDATHGATPVSSTFHAIEGAVNSAANLAGTADGIVEVKAGAKTTKVYINVSVITGRDFYAYVTFVGLGRPISDYIRTVITTDVAARAQHV